MLLILLYAINNVNDNWEQKKHNFYFGAFLSFYMTSLP